MKKLALKILIKLGWVNPQIKIIFNVLNYTYKFLKPIIMNNGIISKELAQQVAKKLDDDIKFKKLGIAGTILELVDRTLFEYALNFIDDKWGDKVPVEAQESVVILLESYVNDDWEACTDDIAELVNHYIDIPLIDEDLEGNLIKGILAAILKKIRSKK